MSQSRRAKKEKDGKTRYEKRVKSRIGTSVKNFNNINMNSVFKEDILTVGIDVKGETDDYVVTISFGGFLDNLHKQLGDREDLTLRDIIRALVRSFNGDNVYVRCTCCLKGDTKIKLLSGESISVEEMVDRFNHGEKMYVYSTDEKGDFKPGEVSNVFVSGHVNDMIRVTLDNGEVVETTPNHLFMLRDGSYERADSLSVGQSLMPMYFKYVNGYESYKKNSITGKTVFNSVYKEVANALLSDEIEYAKIRSGEDAIQIHHADFNKLNNTPENLKPMGQNEHWKYHYDHVKESGQLEKFLEKGREYWKSDEAKKKQAEVCRSVMKKYYGEMSDEEKDVIRRRASENSKERWKNGTAYTESFKEAAQKRGEFLRSEPIEELSRQGVKRYWESISDEEKERRAEIARMNAKRGADSLRGKPFSDEHKKKISDARKNMSDEQREISRKKQIESKILRVLSDCIERGLPLNQDSYDSMRRHGDPLIQKRFRDIDEAVSYFGLNHKVAKIERVHYDNSIPVYDIAVPIYHNFLCDAGVVLHNCDFFYRFGYFLSKDDIIYGERQDIPSDITNPDNDLGRGCKHIMLALSNHSWLIKVASAVNNYIHYMEKHYTKLYQTVIYPAIYDKEYEGDIQLDIFDDDELATSKQDIEKANEYGGRRTQFQKGNEYRFRPREKDIDQIEMEDEVEEEG